MKLIFLAALLGAAATQSSFRSPQRNYLVPAANGFPGGNGIGGGNNFAGGNGFVRGNGFAGSNDFGGSNGFVSGGGNGFQGFNGGNGLIAQASGGFGSAGFNGGINGFNGVNGGANGNGGSSVYGASGANELAELADSLPGGGVPGEDFPVLSEVPDTGFQCGEQAVSGYYADVADEAGCQVFHICQLRESGLVQQDSFLCPNGTIFNQQYLVCDWWFNFDCSTAEDFYSVNDLIGQTSNAQNGLDLAASSVNSAFGGPGGNTINGNGAFGANLNGGGNFGNSGYSGGSGLGSNRRRPGTSNGSSRPGSRRNGGSNGRGYGY